MRGTRTRMIECSFDSASRRSKGALAAVVLDDERLVELRDLHLIPGRQRDDAATKLGGTHREPLRSLLALQQVGGCLEILSDAALSTNRDDVAGPYLVRRNVGLAAIDREMTMANELPCLLARIGESHAEDGVVQPRLQELQQVVTGHAALTDRLGIGFAELRFQHAVVATHLLLLTKLHSIFRRAPRATLAVLAWRKITRGRFLDDGAFRPIAASALEIELDAFTAAKPADWSCIARHSSWVPF